MFKIAILIVFLFLTLNFDFEIKADSNSRHIIILKSNDILQYQEASDGFLSVLKESRINHKVKIISLDNKISSLADIIKEINNEKPELIYTIGTTATQEINKTKFDIPIIFSMVLNPAAQGLLQSASNMNIHLSGVSLDLPVEYQFKKLRHIFPDIRKIAVLYNTAEDDALIIEAQKSADKLGLKLVSSPIKSEREILSVLETIRYQAEILWLIPNPYTMSFSSLKHVFKYCIYNNLPVFGLSEFHVNTGALLALRANYYDNGRQAGELAVQILYNGPFTDQVILIPRSTRLYINMKTAQKMGITIPAEILKEVDQIYE